MSGADALAEALGGGSCDTSGMDESVRKLRDIKERSFRLKLTAVFVACRMLR